MNSSQTMPVARLSAAIVACVTVLCATPASAGITIPNSPLQSGTSVPPNIVFILDDSGSMQSEMLPDELIDDVSRTPSGDSRNSITIGRVFPQISGLYGSDCGGETCGEYANYTADPDDVYGRIVRTPTLNKQYYNPGITYEPWVEADGSSMGDANPECAYWNPYDTSWPEKRLVPFTLNWRFLLSLPAS